MTRCRNVNVRESETNGQTTLRVCVCVLCMSSVCSESRSRQATVSSELSCVETVTSIATHTYRFKRVNEQQERK
jgi:hypothetical protein